MRIAMRFVIENKYEKGKVAKVSFEILVKSRQVKIKSFCIMEIPAFVCMCICMY